MPYEQFMTCCCIIAMIIIMQSVTIYIIILLPNTINNYNNNKEHTGKMKSKKNDLCQKHLTISSKLAAS